MPTEHTQHQLGGGREESWRTRRPPRLDDDVCLRIQARISNLTHPTTLCQFILTAPSDLCLSGCGFSLSKKSVAYKYCVIAHTIWLEIVWCMLILAKRDKEVIARRNISVFVRRFILKPVRSFFLFSYKQGTGVYFRKR